MLLVEVFIIDKRYSFINYYIFEMCTSPLPPHAIVLSRIYFQLVMITKHNIAQHQQLHFFQQVCRDVRPELKWKVKTFFLFSLFKVVL